MNNWTKDKKWSDLYMQHVKAILGQLLIVEASMAEDQLRNTDLIVLMAATKRIAVRIRRPEYVRDYRNDITIRLNRPGGTKTEFRKIIDGWGDLFLYGIAARENIRLTCWTVLDLEIFRQWIRMPSEKRGKLPCEHHENEDGSSEFLAFDWRDFPEGVVVVRRDEAESVAIVREESGVGMLPGIVWR